MIHAAEQDRPDVAARRLAWKVRQRSNHRLDPKKLVFIDETWAKTNMTRLRGRAFSGERVIEKVPHGHWKTTTLISALDHRGIRCATTVDGAVNGDVFTAFVEQVLVKNLGSGEVVVMDNLSSHKVAWVRELIEGAGCELLFLPPYSPDLNPIELAFSKLKTLLRSAKYRLVDLLWSEIQRLLDQITPSDAANFFKHCGYTIDLM